MSGAGGMRKLKSIASNKGAATSEYLLEMNPEAHRRGMFMLAAIHPNGRPEHEAVPREEDVLVEEARFDAACIRLAGKR
jgi:hypothetical protein